MRILFLALLVVVCVTPSRAERAVSIHGAVTTAGSPAAGIFVSAYDSTRGVSYSARTDSHGRYRLTVNPGAYVLTAHARGVMSKTIPVSSPGQGNFELSAAPGRVTDLAPHRYFSMLPDGDEKRRFAVDCLGCHSLNARIVLDKSGKPWDEKGWTAATEKMLSFAGHKTRFPILPPDRDSGKTAAFVSKHITADAIQRASAEPVAPAAATVACDITEYDLPDQSDFPHDLMRDGRGRVLVTGMFSGLMYVLDPETGTFETVEIPVPQANPRALDVDAFGDWWILCGFPNKVARYRVKNGKWDVFDIGMYGHSVGVDTKQRAWFNGHFTRDPIQFGFVDLKTRKTHTLEAPATPMPKEQGSPIPYELRVGPDGTVWMTELAGNRLLRHD